MVPITVDTANRYLFVYTEISTDSKNVTRAVTETVTQNQAVTLV